MGKLPKKQTRSSKKRLRSSGTSFAESLVDYLASFAIINLASYFVLNHK